MKARRLIELVALYVALPALLTLARLVFRTFPVIPVLWLAMAPIAIWLVRRRGYTPMAVLGVGGATITERRLSLTLLRVVPAMAALVALLHSLHPDWLFSFVSSHPKFWIIVMFAYPVLSVIPQGVIYRAFFRERYAPLFPNPTVRTLVAAACFSFCHVFFLNVWALLLTFVGGLLFWRTYEKTGSLLLSNIEHAIYGDLVFTIGYGGFLYHGTMALMNAPN
jgi:membrane protease YdiL (CAAX protease family)